ncbi:MAG TPA: restriction endonuclease subunit S [Candidatus Binatia bacterium]|jgi:type I restriction enzyme S subunit|nr:restriction endonuclease subunit S [Candidatus Binatia bacterium]
MSEPQDQLIALEQVAAPGPHSFVDGPFGSEMKSSEYSERGVRLVQLQNIGDGNWIDDNKRFIPLEKFETLSRHGAVPGDIAIAKMADPVARSCILPAVADQFIVVADCIKLTPDPERFDARFVSAAINSNRTRREAETKSSGTTRLRINLSVLKTVHIWVPQLSEQRQIARTLDTMDEAIAKTEAVIAKLKQVRAGMLHDLLTRGLDEHGQLRDPGAHPEQFHDSPLGRIPREWAVLTIEALLARVPNALRSGPFGSALLKQELKELGIPLLGIDNVHIERFVADYTRFVDDDKFIELKRYAVRAGDVMITIMGTVGRCCVVPDSIGIALSSKHVWTITLDRSRYSPHVACWQMNFAPWVLKQFKRDEQGGVMTAIRSETLRQLLLPVPPLPEMLAIETTLLQFNKRIGEEETLLPKLAALKSGLMSDLLTGRVRVPEGIMETV